MRQAEEAHAGKVCSICGSKGYHEQLVTCSECRIASQHRYCMMNSPTPILEAWICETCEDGKKQTTQLPSRTVPFKSKECAKVKFISAEEVVSLASGSKTPVSSTKGCRGASIPGTRCILQQPSRTMKSTFSRAMATSYKALAYSKEEMIEGSSYAEVHTSPLKVIKPVKRKSSVKLPLPCDDGENSGFCTGIQHMGSNLQGSSLSPKVIMVPKENEIHWSGRFVVRDRGDHIYEGIRAHFNGQISMKAYNASKAMPETLQFSLINRLDVWPRIFQSDPPSYDDAAMRFLPSEFGRPKENYIHLLERMDKYDLAMHCCLDGLELLICTSKLLQLDPWKLNMNSYLWGIFRHRRRKKVNQETKATGEGNCAEADMEIDTVGGSDAGKVDKPVSGPPVVQKDELNDCGSGSVQNGLDRKKSPTTLPKIENYHEEQNIPFTPPGFPKPSKGDSGCENKVNFALEENNLYASPGFPKLSKGDLGGEKNISQVPPGFDKLRKEDAGCEKVKFSLKNPICRKISEVPPGFSRPFIPKHGSGSYEHHAGKNPTSQKCDTRNPASAASRGGCVISSLHTEKAALIKNDDSRNMVTGRAAEASRHGGSSKKASPGSSGYGNQRSALQTNSMPSPSPQGARGKLGHAVDFRSEGQNVDRGKSKYASSISRGLNLSRLRHVNDGKQWNSAAGKHVEEHDYGESN